jgi:transposase-like protein
MKAAAFVEEGKRGFHQGPKALSSLQSEAGYMPASALFRVAARPSLNTGGGSIYVNLLSDLSSPRPVCDTRHMNTPSPNRYKNHRFPAEIISHGVWLYFRFCLSYRDVEELLFARGIIVTYEAIRKWCRKFGQQYDNQLCRRRPRPGDKWHLDEVFLSINGERHYLWRAVDPDGHVLDVLVQSPRDKKAAKKFFRKLLKGLTYVPRVIITDKLKSCGAAKREMLPSCERMMGTWRNHLYPTTFGSCLRHCYRLSRPNHGVADRESRTGRHEPGFSVSCSPAVPGRCSPRRWAAALA